MGEEFAKKTSQGHQDKDEIFNFSLLGIVFHGNKEKKFKTKTTTNNSILVAEFT